jgi:hypothetical protein
MPFMYNAETGQFRSGKGRLVQGEPFKAKPRQDDDGKPVLKADGTPVTEYYGAWRSPRPTRTGWASRAQ